MPEAPDSHIHLSTAAINAVLAHFVNAKAPAQARYENGKLYLKAQGLELIVEEVRFTPEGIDVRLSVE